MTVRQQESQRPQIRIKIDILRVDKADWDGARLPPSGGLTWTKAATIDTVPLSR